MPEHTPSMPQPGMPVGADWGRLVAAAVRALRISGGPGIRVTRLDGGVTISAVHAHRPTERTRTPAEPSAALPTDFYDDPEEFITLHPDGSAASGTAPDTQTWPDGDKGLKKWYVARKAYESDGKSYQYMRYEMVNKYGLTTSVSAEVKVEVFETVDHASQHPE